MDQRSLDAGVAQPTADVVDRDPVQQHIASDDTVVWRLAVPDAGNETAPLRRWRAVLNQSDRQPRFG